MTARKNRVALALPDDLNSTLTTLADLTGQAKTAIITELLIDALPVLTQVVQAIQEAKQGQLKQAVQTAANFIKDATLQINQTTLDLGELKAKHGV